MLAILFQMYKGIYNNSIWWLLAIFVWNGFSCWRDDVVSKNINERTLIETVFHIFPTACLQEIAQEPADKKRGPNQSDLPKFTIDRAVELRVNEYSTTRMRSADVDLGTLPVNSKVTVRLTIENTSSDEIKFASVSTNCSCSLFRTDQYLIPAHGELQASFNLLTPLRRNKPTVTEGIVLKDEAGNGIVRLRLVYRLAGLLSFVDNFAMVHFDADEPVSMLNIPFYCTHPLVIEELSVRGSDNLRDLVLKLSPSEIGGYVEATIASDVVEAGGISGELTLEHPKTGLSTHCFFTVKHRRHADISPSVIRFKMQDSDDTELVGHAIVRIPNTPKDEAEEDKTEKDDSEKAGTSRPGKKQKASTSQANRDVKIACFRGDEPVQLTVHALSDAIFRVRVVIPAIVRDELLSAKTDDAMAALRWRVRVDHVESNVFTEFIFE